MELVTRMVEHHVWLVGELLARAERLPDEVLDGRIELSVEGIDEEPTIRSLLARLVAQLAMWNGVVEGAPPHGVEARAEAAISALCAEHAVSGPAFLTHTRAVTAEGRLGDTFVDAVCDPPEVFTFGGMIAHVLTFAAHRRLLVLGALADHGVDDLGAGDPLRWVEEAA